ncbi:MAG: efflux RND transporter permease subunit, partial [Bacteroidota bacterium]
MAEVENQNQVTREFKLTNFSVSNRTSVLILTAIIVFAGWNAYTTMPKESFPEIVFPFIYVGTVYPGNSPVDIENLVTRPIEKELKNINGVKVIRSTSIQDFSSINVEFNPEVDVETALQDVKDAVDRAKGDLPTDLDTDPDVFEVDLSELPIMFINLSGDYSLQELKVFAEYLQDEIENLPQISKADIRGALEREIRIDADPYRMEAMEVGFGDIIQAVQGENVTISGGDIKMNEFRRSLRVVGEFSEVSQIEDVIIKDQDQRIVYVRDVATVRDTNEEPASFARADKQPVLTLNVVKRGGENLIEAADQIKAILAEAQATRFPEDLNISITNDQSKFTRSQLDNLENSIISGVILVILVLMFFLGLRNALFVGIAIPLSMLISFSVLNAYGVTLNLMVLFSLILALGMLVDNGIVVVENIYRLMSQGMKPLQAAKLGVGEVAWPIIASTATTLAAFLPLAFWQSTIGEFFKFLPITLIIVLSSSLFVALVINPVLTAMYMKVGRSKVRKVRLLIIAGISLALGILLNLGGNHFLGNIAIFASILIPINVFLLIPATYWFQD